VEDGRVFGCGAEKSDLILSATFQREVMVQTSGVKVRETGCFVLSKKVGFEINRDRCALQTEFNAALRNRSQLMMGMYLTACQKIREMLLHFPYAYKGK
jgi:hypothetical protein